MPSLPNVSIQPNACSTIEGKTDIRSYQIWPASEENVQKKVPFTSEAFDYMSDVFSLSPEYLYVLSQNRYTPLHLTLPNSEREWTSKYF